MKRLPWPALALVVAAIWILRPGAATPPTGNADDNGLWMRRRWLHEARTPDEVAALVQTLKARGVTQLYPFLGPLGAEGRPGWRDGSTIRPYTPELASAFFAAIRAADPALMVLPWSGGVNGRDVQLDDPAFRARFAAAMAEVVALGAHGVQINVEPMRSGSAGYLALLREIKAAIGDKAILSIAAYPPTTPLHPFPDVHWDLDYTTQVCAIADDLAFMAYDTAQTEIPVYTGLVRDWTLQLAQTLPPPDQGGCTWRIGLPAYEDDEPYHHPEVETIGAAIDGVNAALSTIPAPAGFRGVAIYASWTTDDAEWATYDQRWRGRDPVSAARIDAP